MEYTHLDENAIHSATNAFKGEIFQVPPIHSAIKVGGQPVYKLARRGEEVQLEPRKITIKEFEITNIAMPRVEFRVVCSTGTYIRSLANDYGQALGVGAYLSSLCRTRIGGILLENAKTIPEAEKWIMTAMEKSE
jgi:tRNA pseudouridine55 synthase